MDSMKDEDSQVGNCMFYSKGPYTKGIVRADLTLCIGRASVALSSFQIVTKLQIV